MKYNNQYTLPIIVVTLIVIFGMINPVFISLSNLANVLDQITIIGVIALGMTVVVILGGIDLSVGSIVALSGIVLGNMLLSSNSLMICLLVCLTSGLVLGLLNGVFIAYGKVQPFIATLGSMSFIRGVAFYLSDGRSISGFPNTLTSVVNYTIFGISTSILLFILLSIFLYIFLKCTYWGKYIYAIGGNEKAAWLSGVQVTKYKLFVYGISGLVSSISCILLVGKLNSAQPQAGTLYELNAIAAVVIGGASLSGGKGSIRNTFLGILILGVLQNGFSILNVSSYYQQILVGLIIIFAVLTDTQSSRKFKYED